MKTFLWTSLFWIIVVIVGLLCLGFGNLGTQVLDNNWMVRIMPKNLQPQACDYDGAIASTLESIDWCAAAQTYNCYYEDAKGEESVNIPELVESLNILSTNQETIYNQMNESFSAILQNISALSEQLNLASGAPTIDEREQQRLQLQAQIEALQNEMANL